MMQGAAIGEANQVQPRLSRHQHGAVAHPGMVGMAVGDDRHIAQVMVQRRSRVLHHDDEGAAAHAGAVHIAWGDTQRFGDERR